ncbi:MAG: DUF58 domain-containing protein [Candidatus Promineifilaceae bacterium]
MNTRQTPIIVICLLLFAGLLRVDFVFYIAYVLAGLFLFSWWFTPRLLKGVHAKRSYAPNAFLGETVPVTIELENPSRLPMPWLHVQEMTALNLRSGTSLNDAVALGGRSSIKLTYEVRAMRRGYYRVGPLRLESADVFGMRDAKGEFSAEYLTVYPHIIPIAKLNLRSRLPFGTIASKQRLYADPARPMGVRNFRSGDSMRQINWKASARLSQSAGNNLLVKTLEPAISLQTMILLDLDNKGYMRQTRLDTVEWAIVVAASIAAHLVNQRQPVGLVTSGYDPLAGEKAGGTAFDEGTGRLTEEKVGDVSAENAIIQTGNLIAPRKGRAHLMRVLELLARVEARRTTHSFADFATRAMLRQSWGTTLIVISPNGDETMTGTLHRLIQSGFSPVLLVVQPTSNFGQIRERARRLGVMAHAVFSETDLGQIR